MLDREHFVSLPSYLDLLSHTSLPIFVWGMGDGCIKLMNIFEKYKIPCAGIFASDEFVRDKVFLGHKIHSLSEIEDSVDDFIIVLAFGAGYKSLIEKIDGISKRHRLIVPDMPVIGEGLFTKEYFKEHFEELDKAHDLLIDDRSKLVYEKLIEFRITGDISALKACETDSTEAYSILSLDDTVTCCDLGAYTGDTIQEFLNATGGKYDRIVAIEPNQRNFRKLTENTSALDNITLVNAAAGSCDGVITVLKGGGRMIRKAEKGVEVRQVALDSVIGDMDFKRVYIKYDVEGAELEAIKGSELAIKRFHPDMNVAIYHRVEDIFALPLYINSLMPKAKLYMRHFPYYPAWDSVLIVKG